MSRRNLGTKSVKLEVDGLDDTINGLLGTVKTYNKEATKFLRAEGKKLKTRVKRQAGKSGLKEKTGNYINSITAQKPYRYYKSTGTSNDSVKVYAKHSTRRGNNHSIVDKSEGKYSYGGGNHAHLIEKGHKKVLWGNRTAERVRAFYIYRDARNEYEAVFERNCETFINKVVGMF